MEVKAILVGVLLGCALLIFSIPLKKTTYGLGAMILALLLSLLSGTAALILCPLLALALMLLPAGTTGTSGPRRCLITCTAGPLAGMQYELTEGRELTIGRENCLIPIPEDTQGISRHHCRLFMRGGTAYLEDNHSSFGTYLIPGDKIDPANGAVPLADNAVFCLASTDVAFRVNYQNQG